MNRNLLLAFAGSLLLAACALFEGEIATQRKYVPPGTAMVGTGIEVLDEDGIPTDEWVIVDSTTELPPEAPVVDPADVEAGDKNAVLTTIDAVGRFFPGPIQPFMPLLAYLGAKLFAKRNRQNWAAAIKHTTQGNLREGVRMVGAAEGLFHTSEDPQKLMAVAQRKMAVARAAQENPAPTP